MSGKDKVKLLSVIINRITALIIIIVLAALIFTHKPESLNATIEISSFTIEWDCEFYADKDMGE